jgi:hypothetical protein
MHFYIFDNCCGMRSRNKGRVLARAFQPNQETKSRSVPRLMTRYVKKKADISHGLLINKLDTLYGTGFNRALPMGRTDLKVPSVQTL